MLGIATSPRDRALEAAFLVFTVICLGLMLVLPGPSTIPYHLVFLALTIVYGFAVWPPHRTLAWLLFVTITTGTVMLHLALTGEIEWEECSEIILMPAIFLGQRWHLRRQLHKQRTVELRAVHQERLLDREQRFLQDAAHAIRTPLTIARGHVELVAADQTDPVHAEDLLVVTRELDRLSRLASALLALEEMERPDPLDLSVVDVGQLVQLVGGRWTKSVDRCWEFDAWGGRLVVADSNRLISAVDAIIENAVKFTGPGDRIKVQSTEADGFVGISVEDSGPGIAPADRSCVFDRFWKGQRPGVEPGSGLGLALVRAVAETHAGRCCADESALGGARIRLELPAAPQPAGALA